MTPPADLVAIRALVERAGKDHSPFDHDYVRDEKRCAACKAILAAQEELGRVDDILLKDRIKTREINILTKENREQAARLAQLEGRDE